MEESDRERIVHLAKTSYQARKLYERHEAYERQLEKFDGRPFLCSTDEQAARKIKKAKLDGVDAMMDLLRKGVLSG